MISADQLLCHALGDYILQSDWQATEKTKKSLAAAAHAICYALPFLFLTRAWPALAIIVGTHFIIDRWRLARYVVWAKNWLAPWKMVPAVGPDGKPYECLCRNGLTADFKCICIASETVYRRPTPPFRECAATGYPPDRPVWLTTWLLIIGDNVLHVICNGAAIYYFGQ